MMLRTLSMRNLNVFDKFMKMLGDFNTGVGRENVFKPIIENESLHEVSSDNRVRVLNSPTSKKLRV